MGIVPVYETGAFTKYAYGGADNYISAHFIKSVQTIFAKLSNLLETLQFKLQSYQITYELFENNSTQTKISHWTTETLINT